MCSFVAIVPVANMKLLRSLFMKFMQKYYFSLAMPCIHLPPKMLFLPHSVIVIIVGLVEGEMM